MVTHTHRHTHRHFEMLVQCSLRERWTKIEKYIKLLLRQNVHILLEKNHISQIAACILAQGKSLNFWSIIMKYPVLIDYLACCKLTPIYNCFRHLLGILTVFSMGLFSPYPLDSSSANDRPFKKNKFNSLNVLRFNFEEMSHSQTVMYSPFKV